MAAMKRAYEQGHRAPPPAPAHGGLYRYDGGYYWLSQGPCPAYRPTRAELTSAGIDPARFLEEARRGAGRDFPELAAQLETSPHAPRLDRAEDRRPVPAGNASRAGRRRNGGDDLQGQLF